MNSNDKIPDTVQDTWYVLSSIVRWVWPSAGLPGFEGVVTNVVVRIINLKHERNLILLL